ncbi:MAG: hypothetical protein ABSE73_17995 [Planctomycetota bacterium]
MRVNYDKMDIMEHCRHAREAIQRRYKTLDGLYQHYLRLEKKYAKNIAWGRRLLAERDAARSGVARAPKRSKDTVKKNAPKSVSCPSASLR